MLEEHEEVPWANALRAALGGLTGFPPAFDVDLYGMDLWRVRRVSPVFDWLYDRWFRVQEAGFENLHGPGPRLLVCNRAGFLPWDAAMVSVAAARHKLFVRVLLEAELFEIPYLGLFLRRMGAVPACRENAERLLSEGQDLVIFPEGRRGARKPFRQRGRVGDFGRGGFVRIAKKVGARIYPVAIAGSARTHPLLANLALGSESAPAIPITPTFPWLGLLGLVPLPSRWRIEAGEEIGPEEFPAEGDGAAAAEVVRLRVQELLDRARRRRRAPNGQVRFDS
ncbi:MAG: 1-acyl-sn-glycerol-3-phosphate acyltransferase [Pseudomonadota bacterium]|nr:MAG: hypothetical protein DIU72_05540 [Pseudomonadota bacterium]